MARVAERLSARTVQTVKERGLYADGKGLYLRIGPSCAKSWIYRYRGAGQRHDLGLGPYPDITLADARERAAQQRRLRLNGHDPLSIRRSGQDQARLAAGKATTFRHAQRLILHQCSGGAAINTLRNGKARSPTMFIRSSATCLCNRLM